MKYSKELMESVVCGDWHTRLKGVRYSTSLRELITVGDMMEFENEKAAPVATTETALIS